MRFSILSTELSKGYSGLQWLGCALLPSPLPTIPCTKSRRKVCAFFHCQIVLIDLWAYAKWLHFAIAFAFASLPLPRWLACGCECGNGNGNATSDSLDIGVWSGLLIRLRAVRLGLPFPPLPSFSSCACNNPFVWLVLGEGGAGAGADKGSSLASGCWDWSRRAWWQH